MKTLGIIGGLGPESTIDYYGRIIALYRERTGDGSYPQFIINSINLKKGLDFMDASNLAGMAEYLLEEIGKLAQAGAQVAASVDQCRGSNMCGSQSAKFETARLVRDPLYHAGKFLS